MGLYDYVAGMQVKATPNPYMHSYEVGDQVPLQDGAYLCYEGIFVVKNGRVLTSTEDIYDKWGGTLNLPELLDALNPISQAIKEMDKKKQGR